MARACGVTLLLAILADVTMASTVHSSLDFEEVEKAMTDDSLESVSPAEASQLDASLPDVAAGLRESQPSSSVCGATYIDIVGCDSSLKAPQGVVGENDTVCDDTNAVRESLEAMKDVARNESSVYDETPQETTEVLADQALQSEHVELRRVQGNSLLMSHEDYAANESYAYPEMLEETSEVFADQALASEHVEVCSIQGNCSAKARAEVAPSETSSVELSSEVLQQRKISKPKPVAMIAFGYLVQVAIIVSMLSIVVSKLKTVVASCGLVFPIRGFSEPHQWQSRDREVPVRVNAAPRRPN